MLGDRWLRNVIPRWRSSTVGASTLEAGPSKFSSVQTSEPNLLPIVDERIQEWLLNKTLGGAADLLAYDQFPGTRPRLVEVARFVLSHSEPIPAPLLGAAQRVVGVEIATESNIVGPKSQQISEIRELRHRLALNPRNAIAYIDLARWYAALGRNEQALRLLTVGRALEPNSRFVIRATARFHIHTNNPEKALSVVNDAEGLKEDPWLMASSVAISNLLGRPSRILKHARRQVAAKTFHPSQTSELASSIATLEMFSGSNKSARRLFETALQIPNDNSVAQALWASEHLKAPIDVDKRWLTDPLSAEARYYQAFFSGNLDDALRFAKEWFLDEPFSSRPMNAASFIAGLQETFGDMERYCRIGLVADAGNVGLLNNLAFALTSQWKLEDAAEVLRGLLLDEKDDLSGHTLANLGQLMYREGHLVEGEMLYRRAIDRLRANNLASSQALAMGYMAREAKLARAQNASAIFEQAKQLAEQFPSTGGDVVIKSVERSPSIVEAGVDMLRKLRWRYSSEKNLLLPELKKISDG